MKKKETGKNSVKKKRAATNTATPSTLFWSLCSNKEIQRATLMSTLPVKVAIGDLREVNLLTPARVRCYSPSSRPVHTHTQMTNHQCLAEHLRVSGVPVPPAD